MIRQAGRLDAAALAAALDDGVASGMIEEVPGHTLAHRFTHELVRRALYDRLAAGRRAELHLRIAEALDERASDGSARALGDIAHHFAAAAPIGGADRAVEYSLLAAAAAMVALAFDEAAVALRTALELGIPGGTDRADALLDLGAVTYRAGRSVESQDAYLAAADIARSLGDGKRLVTRRGRLRGRLLADGDRRPGRAPASRGGGRGPRSGRLRAACARAERAGPGAGLRRQARRERDGARRGDRHGPPDRRPAGARARAQPLLLAARSDAVSRHPRHAGGGARHRPAAGRHRDRRRGVPVAYRIAHRDRRPRAPRGSSSRRCSTWPDGCASPSRSMWPSSMRPRSRCATGACARRRPPPSDPGSGAACSPGATRRASTASRCSASAASRAGSPSWRRRSGRSPSRTARRHGGPGSPRSWPSSG